MFQFTQRLCGGSPEKRKKGVRGEKDGRDHRGVLDFRPPLDSLAHLSTNNVGLNVLLLYHYVTVMRDGFAARQQLEVAVCN